MTKSPNILSYTSVSREDIEVICTRFQFLRNYFPNSPLLTTYMGIKFLACNGCVVAEICEKAKTRSVTFSTHKEELIYTLLALREIESMGIRASTSSDPQVWCHWAQEWLFGDFNNDQVSILEQIPVHVRHLVPSELHNVKHARDILGFISMTGDPEMLILCEIQIGDKSLVTSSIASIPLTEVVALLRESSISDQDRPHVYETILGKDDDFKIAESDFMHPSFVSRYSSIVYKGHRCVRETSGSAQRFYNRTVLHDFPDAIFKFLRLVDPPLADALTIHDVEPLWTSVLACTLKEDDLKKLWDALLVSSPELLVRVIAFSLVEVRDLIGDNKQGVLLTIGDLIQDFNSIIQLALANDGLE